MKQITKTRKAVCAMANQLRKAGSSLSQAFKKAWSRVKLSMTIRAAGTTFENRQERLGFLKQFRLEDLSVTLEKEPENKFDSNAIRIVVHIHPISKKTVIGYVPNVLAKELSKVMDAGGTIRTKMLGAGMVFLLIYLKKPLTLRAFRAMYSNGNLRKGAHTLCQA